MSYPERGQVADRPRHACGHCLDYDAPNAYFELGNCRQDGRQVVAADRACAKSPGSREAHQEPEPHVGPKGKKKAHRVTTLAGCAYRRREKAD